MCGHVEVHDTSSMMTKNDKDVWYVERRRWNGKEVDGDDVLDVVIEKRSPSLRRRLPNSNPILPHSLFGNYVPQQRKF